MYSETLRLMDQNMIKFMIDEQKEILEEQNKKLEEQQEKLEEQQEKLDAQQEKLDAQQEIIAIQKTELVQKDSVIFNLKRQLSELQNKS